jgi:F0F1-type ATP synthase membrane subunit c/vacuolar-type H+-ATPase subunit K
VSASAPSSRWLSGRRVAQSVRRAGSIGNLIFGFAITEALGIFSLLIALLLLFAL